MALRYGELHAYDANEQALPARLRVEEGRVILEVEDARAVYPVRIDPLLTQQQKLTASDGAAGDISAPRWPSAGTRPSWEHM